MCSCHLYDASLVSSHEPFLAFFLALASWLDGMLSVHASCTTTDKILGNFWYKWQTQVNWMNVFVYFLQSMKSGNLQQLNESLEERQWEFIRQGTFLILEKLKFIVARRLLKKIYVLKAEKTNQLNLGKLHIWFIHKSVKKTRVINILALLWKGFQWSRTIGKSQHVQM